MKKIEEKRKKEKRKEKKCKKVEKIEKRKNKIKLLDDFPSFVAFFSKSCCSKLTSTLHCDLD